MVLCKSVDEHGFQFFTNYESKKASDLSSTSRAALVFYWASLHRSVRVSGSVTRLSEQESDAYFAVRPRASQLGAWASHQSSIVSSREVAPHGPMPRAHRVQFLEEAYKEVEQRFPEGTAIPRPAFWSVWYSSVTGGHRDDTTGADTWSPRSRLSSGKVRAACPWSIAAHVHMTGRRGRLHDRIVFRRSTAEAPWDVTRLSP